MRRPRWRVIPPYDTVIDPVTVPALAGPAAATLAIALVVAAAGLAVGPGRWWCASAAPGAPSASSSALAGHRGLHGPGAAGHRCGHPALPAVRP